MVITKVLTPLCFVTLVAAIPFASGCNRVDAQSVGRLADTEVVLVFDSRIHDATPNGLYLSLDAHEYYRVPEDFEESFRFMFSMGETDRKCVTEPWPTCQEEEDCPEIPKKQLVGCVGLWSSCACMYINPIDSSPLSPFVQDIQGVYSGIDPDSVRRVFMNYTSLEDAVMLEAAVKKGGVLEMWF